MACGIVTCSHIGAGPSRNGCKKVLPCFIFSNITAIKEDICLFAEGLLPAGDIVVVITDLAFVEPGASQLHGAACSMAKDVDRIKALV